MSKDRDEIFREWQDLVNMGPDELERWLETDESKAVGNTQDGESTGHYSGRRIVTIERTKRDDLSDDQWEWMHKVVNYIKRHKAQPPKDDEKHSDWRYSLMNWGHDPLKD